MLQELDDAIKQKAAAEEKFVQASHSCCVMVMLC